MVRRPPDGMSPRGKDLPIGQRFGWPVVCSAADPLSPAGRPGPSAPERGGREGSTDAEAGMPSAEASGAICVQRLDDSRNSAIHIKYRISLRSSSLREPRYPLLRVV